MGGPGGSASSRARPSGGSSSRPDPRFYQEIRERGLNTSQESDEDLLEGPPSPEEARRGDNIVVKSYRPAQLTWSQLPEVGWATREPPRRLPWERRVRASSVPCSHVVVGREEPAARLPKPGDGVGLLSRLVSARAGLELQPVCGHMASTSLRGPSWLPTLGREGGL